MSDFTYLSLFSGVGGLDLGLDRAGWTCIGQVERDPYCQSVLARHWPKVPRHDDVRTAPAWWASRPRPAVRAVAGGFPCQPVSTAGRGLGADDERWLWPEMAQVIDAVRPDWVVGENVPGLRTRGLTDVLRDLARLGYRARAGYISACAMGAPHPRRRLFILAHAAGLRCGQRRRDSNDQPARRARPAADGSAGWATEPPLARVADGVPRRLVRDPMRALGNAVVPAVGEYIGRLITGGAA